MMHNQVVNSEFDPPDYRKYKDIVLLHDAYSRLRYKMRTRKRDLPCHLNLDDTVEEIKFKQPADTYELIDIGEQMSICVAAYDERVISRQCSIVVGYEKNIPVICLELSSALSLRQAKGVRNQHLDNNKLNAAIKWCHTRNIEYKNCRDLEDKQLEITNIIRELEGQSLAHCYFE